MKKIVIHINNLKNSNDSIKIEKKLNKNRKIQNSIVDYKRKIVTIDYFDDLTIEEIEELIQQEGFEVSNVDFFSNTNTISFPILITVSILSFFILCISVMKTFHVPLISFLNTTHNQKIYNVLLLIIAVGYLFYNINSIIDSIKKMIKFRGDLNSLVTIAIISSLFYSVCQITVLKEYKNDYHSLFIEMPIILMYFMKIGIFFEKKNNKNIEADLKYLTKNNLNKVNKKGQDGYQEIDIEEVHKGDILLCMPGDRILVDGIVHDGITHFDESMITGKSLPLLKDKKDKILAGSINYENEIEYEVINAKNNSSLEKIIKKILNQKVDKRNYLQIIDKMCLYYIPLVFVIGNMAGIINYLTTNEIVTSIEKTITIFLLSCPCGLLISAPIGITKCIRFSHQKGLLLVNKIIEDINKVDTIVFDKTGTLTNGYLSISRVNNHSEVPDKELLQLLGSIEKHSTHALARGITKYLRNEKIPASYDFITEDLFGYGVKAKNNQDIYYACNSKLLEKLDIINSYKEEERKMQLEGNKVIYLVKNNKVIATFGLKDILRKESKKVIQLLLEKKKEIILLTGDDETTATKVAKELGIIKVLANRNEIEKMKDIQELLDNGKKVMFVGDGFNDALALSKATIGVCLKSSQDITMASADVVLLTNNLSKIIDYFQISKKTRKTIIENMIISLTCSLITIIILFVKGTEKTISILLIGSMIISTILVILNMIRKKKAS